MTANSSQQNEDTAIAWLENGAEKIQLTSPFSIGRTSRSSFTIAESDISRKHTLLQFNQLENNWLLTDLGSTNGTYLNNRRITKPHTLKRGDLIKIADHQFTFQMEFDIDEDESPTESILTTKTIDQETIVSIDTIDCFLLVADVEGSTRLSQTVPPDELSAKIRTWAGECEALVLKSRGIVNEFMGDGLLAFWRYDDGRHGDIVEMLSQFNEMKSKAGLGFRVVLHYGTVGIGGGVSSGIEKLGGRELNYIFKIEKSAGLSGAKVSLTQSAFDKLHPAIDVEDLGDFAVSGFEGTQKLYAPKFV